MILQDFNNGWGESVALRQFERQLLTNYLSDWYHDSKRSVLINSTWYTQEYHQQVLQYLSSAAVDRIALYSFMDPAIPQPEWYSHLNIEVRAIGYYKGPDEIDAWALVVDQHFSDLQQLPEVDSIDTAFLCYNRKPHWHRQRLIRQLSAAECLHSGVVTLGGENGTATMSQSEATSGSALAPNPGADCYGIVNDIMSLGPKSTWHRCLLNVVTETVFDVDRQWFVSEKIYKPVVGLKPFLVYAPNGAQQWLQHVGIESFVGDFADISDLDLADPENIAAFLAVLSKKDQLYFRYKYTQLKDKIYHNRCMFEQYVHQLRHKHIIPHHGS